MAAMESSSGRPFFVVVRDNLLDFLDSLNQSST